MVYVLIRGNSFNLWYDEKAYWFLALPVFYFALCRIVQDVPKSAYWFISIALLSGIIQAVLASLQLYKFIPSHFSGHITGTFFNPALLGGYMAALLPLALVYSKSLFIPHTKKQGAVWGVRAIAGLALILFIVVLPATYNRASWLAAITGCAVVFAFDRRTHAYLGKNIFNSKLKIWLGSTLVPLFLLVLLVGIYWLKKDSANGRMLTWNVGYQMVLDAPIFGHGFNRLQALFLNYQQAYFGSGLGTEAEGVLAGNIHWAFNEVLQLVVELGIIGFVLFVFWCISLFFPFKEKRQNKLSRAVMASFISLVVFGMFSYPSYSSPLVVLFVFFAAILSSRGKALLSPIFAKAFTVGLCLVFLVLSVFYMRTLPAKYNAYWYWDEANKLYNIEEYTLAAESFEEAYPVLQQNGKYLLNYGKCLYFTEKYDSALILLKQAEQHWSDDVLYNTLGDTHKALKHYSKAESYYQKASNTVPHKFFPRYQLANLYLEWGDTVKAQIIANEIMHKPIKIPSTAIDEMKTDMRKILNDGQGM